MGVDGIAISAGGLTADFDSLYDACIVHHMAAKQAGAPREQNSIVLARPISRVV
jgi:hypothetical protein